MATINIYKGLNNTKTVKANGKLEEILKDFCPEINANHCIYLNGGKTVSKDYEAKDGEIIFIREAPGAVGAIIVASVAAACAIAGLVVGIVGAVEANNAKKEMEKAERESRELSQQAKTLPFLKGAKNQNAIGKNIPFIMGSMRIAPYTLTNGFYTIGGANGKDQYWNCILAVGYNNCFINNLSIGNQRIVNHNTVYSKKEYDGSEEKIYYMSKTDYGYLFHSGRYCASGNTVQIKDKGELTIPGLDEKITSTSYSDKIPHSFSDDTEWKNGIIKNLESNTCAFDVCVFFNGLRKYRDGWRAKKVEISVYWSNSEAEKEEWHKVGTISTGEVNSDQTVRFEFSYIFSASECYKKDIRVKLVRETPEEESNSQETCYLGYINCHQYDVFRSTPTNIVKAVPVIMPWRDRITRIGLRIPANDSTKDTLNEINCMVYGSARIWTGSSWTTYKAPTRNPAAWILEIMTTDIHRHSSYKDEEIDLDSLGALYEYCYKNKFYSDGIITADIKKFDLISNILCECNATMYLNSENKWTFACEDAGNFCVALLNEQSIIKTSVLKSFEKKPYAEKITFVDRTVWETATTYVDEDGKIEAAAIYGKEKIITESAVNYITDGNHAFKFAYRQMARQKLQPREITVQVGPEGDFYPLYSRVLLQQKTLSIGLSSGVLEKIYITNGLVTEIETSDLCEFDPTKRIGIIIQTTADKDAAIYPKHFIKIQLEVLGIGSNRTKHLQIASPEKLLYTPQAGDIYSFGYLDDNGSFKTITNEMMIYGSKQNENGWELTLRDFNPDMFKFDSIPEYQSNLTQKFEDKTEMPALSYSDISSMIADASARLHDGMTIYMEKPSYTFAATAMGITKESVTVESVVHLIVDGNEVPFEFGAIEQVPGLKITTSYRSVIIESVAGEKINSSGVIKIPVKFKTLKDFASFQIDDLENTLGFGKDEIGFSVDAEKEVETEVYFSYAKALEGAGVQIVETFYGSTKTNEKPLEDKITEGDISKVVFNDEYKYLWAKSVTIYTDSRRASVIELKAVYGDKGDTGAKGDEGYSAYIENPMGIFTCDPDGKAYSDENEAIIHLVHNGVEMPFRIESITNKSPDFYKVYIQYHSVKVNSVPGTLLPPYSSIKIKIALDVSSSEYALGFDSSMLGFLDSSLGYRGNDGKTIYFTLEFCAYSKKVGIYQGVKTSIDNYLVYSGKRYKGDWFVWGGSEDGSVSYNGVQYKFLASCAYIWTGQTWIEDKNPAHASQAFSDIISVANDLLEKNNSMANLTLNRLVANQVFCKRLVASAAFIENLFSKNITLQNGGVIKSSNYKEGESGWQISSDGKAEFTEGKFKGSVEATSIVASSAYIEGEIRSPDFDESKQKGYNLYIDLDGAGQAVITMLHVKRIRPLVSRTPITFPDRLGISTYIYSCPYPVKRYQSWEAIFSNLADSADIVSISGLIVNGYINGKACQRLDLARSPSGDICTVAYYGYQPNGSFYSNYISADGGYPKESVDIIF